MILENHAPTIEISVEKKQEKEKFLFTSRLKPKPGQRVWRFNTYTRRLGEVEFFKKSDTLQYEDIISGKYLRRDRDILVEEGYDYVIKLNYDNALKHFEKKWPGGPIEPEDYKANRLFKNQKVVNIFMNKG